MSYNGSGVFTINTTGQPVVTGTTISSTAFNTLTADLATGLTTALTKDGQSTPTANIKLGAFKITNLGAATLASDAARLDQIQGGGAFTFVTVAGTDTITGTTSPTLTAYATGNQFSFLVANTNTGAVTINVDALGAKAITRTGTTALVAGDMVAGQMVEIIYDGTRFQLINGNSFTNVKVSGTLAVTGVATLVAPVLGTPTSVTLTNATGLPPSGVVGTAAILGANTFTAAQEWATGSNIASAATVNLDTATGNRVHITGTTAITAVTLTRGPRTVIFDGILTLTHHATTNNLPGAANITTAAGDRAIYESDGTTVYCVSYIKVSGAAVVSPPSAMTLLSTVTASASATVDVETTFSSTYDAYLLVATGITVGTDTTKLGVQMKLAGAYVTTGTYSYHSQGMLSNGVDYDAAVSSTATSILVTKRTMNTPATTPGNSLDFKMWIYTPSSTAHKKVVDWSGVQFDNGTNVGTTSGFGSNSGTDALTGLRFAMSSGNIATGTFRLYGIANS